MYSARFASTLISFASVIVFYLIAWKVCSRPSIVKTLQYSFFPLFFPFFPLVYTDILAILMILLAFYCILWNKYTLSGLIALLSVLVRTNNIIWFAFLYMFIYIENYGYNLKAFTKSIKLSWFYLIIFGLFGLFIFINRGVALTDKGMQPVGGLYSGNIFFLLFVWTFLFLPLNIANTPRILNLLKNAKWILPAGFAIYLLYILTFQSNHPYNQTNLSYFLRNQLLVNVTHNWALKNIFFIPVAWSALSIGVTRLRQRNFYWLYPFTALSLLPIWLIEPRYSFVPISFFLLFKEEKSRRVEWVTIAIYVVIALLLLSPLRSELFFI
jgi:hypothetical protein